MIEFELKTPPGLSGGAIDGIQTALVMGLADMARAEWMRLAMSELTTTQQAYLSGIGPSEMVGKDTVRIPLTGQMPTMIEMGWEGGDMRRSLLGAGNAKRKRSAAGHYYAHIPFSHAGPGASGKSGRPMPNPIHKAAKSLKGTLTAPGGRVTLWGDRLKSGLAAKLRPHHVTDLYAGMVRQEKTYAKATQSTYRTFRTISSNPGTRTYIRGGRVERGHLKPGQSATGRREVGWIHPGIKAHKFIDRVARFVASHAGALIRAAMGG